MLVVFKALSGINDDSLLLNQETHTQRSTITNPIAPFNVLYCKLEDALAEYWSSRFKKSYLVSSGTYQRTYGTIYAVQHVVYKSQKLYVRLSLVAVVRLLALQVV